MEGEVKGKTFKMKGHTLPGINQRSDANAANVAEQGLAGSSTFQFSGGIGAPMIKNMMAGNPRDPQRGGSGMLGGAGNVASMVPPLMYKPSIAKDMITGKYKQKFEK